MKEYIGVDLGKRKAVVVKKDRQGKITSKVTVAVTQAALESYFSKQDLRRPGSGGNHGQLDVSRDDRTLNTRGRLGAPA